MIDPDRLLALVRALNREGVEYVVVGATALGLHGLARATEDVDLFVRPTPENVARLRRALAAVWSDPDIDTIVASDLAGEYPTIRYGPPDGSFTLDLLARLGERFGYDDIEAVSVEFEGEPIRTATPRTLYRMKHDTVRPLDRADAAALQRTFGLEDE
ncbi:MAG: nucleotidyl transferase AbiEii/AbiGii toxin family protein [Thiotrichales bacterium]|nr:nucleotidyl transferase AbiEii/AbiGii toxin family protein [Thiotrichales bacterium]MCY4285976.1 nucleotidyl transferase AbiEii/AbiGii toxin family protein [Thiotrichales bacterium]MCY4351153.1 nucleotidyl transferase AbiEii/AbiGii toxin family protein [Thiotrichales bacterium]